MSFRARFPQWIWNAAGAAGAVLLLSALSIPSLSAEGAAPVPTPGDSATPSSQPYRGFDVPSLDPDLLSDAANKWHANIVRYMMRSQFEAKNHCHCSNQEAWNRMMAALPAELDTAKQLHLVVVLAMFQPPVEHFPAGPNGRAQNIAFWADDDTLQVLTQAWTQIAKICANRDQVIWFDLLNEPLDWDDMPSYPRKWPFWAQTLINTIRQIDQNHQIVIEPGPGGQPTGFKSFPKLKGEGLIYSFHDYQPANYTEQGMTKQGTPDREHPETWQPRHWPMTPSRPGEMSWDKRRMEQWVQPAVEFQNRNHARIYVGEFSVVRWAPDAPQWLTDMINVFEGHGWDWTYHAFREAGLWSLERTSSYTQPQDLQGSGQTTDRGQVILQYLSRNQTSH